MFLHQLSKKHKEAFWFLTKEILKEDGIDVLEEKVLKTIAYKLEIEVLSAISSEQEAFNILKDTKNIEKRTIYIEIISAIYATNDEKLNEHPLLKTIENEFGLPEDFCQKAKNWTKTFLKSVENGYDLVEGL
ncbi:MAG: hypothetical protein LBT51_09010 [Fusobacteriaceae bacterium]|nr:hypothetical protein [Fusobacteriaceae bacterium]